VTRSEKSFWAMAGCLVVAVAANVWFAWVFWDMRRKSEELDRNIEALIAAYDAKVELHRKREAELRAMLEMHRR
jgi:hypothetical protein